MSIPGFVSFFSFSFSTFPVSPLSPFGWVARFVEPFSFSFNTSACLLLAVDDRVTLPSLDIGVGREVAFVALVRVTPLGPAFAALERNLEALVDFVTGSLDGSGAFSFALPFPFSPDSVVSGAGGGTKSGTTGSVVTGVVVKGVSSDGTCFSGCGSGIIEAAGKIDSGSGAGPFEAFEVNGSSGYGSAGIGGSAETDLDLETRWEGGVGDLEGNRNDSGFGCGGIRWDDCLVGPDLESGFDCDGSSGCGCGFGCGGGAGGSRFMASVVVSSLGGRGEVDGSGCLDKPGEPKGIRGDIDSSNDRVFRTGVFGSASGSRLNGSSFRGSEVEVTTKAGGG